MTTHVYMTQGISPRLSHKSLLDYIAKQMVGKANTFFTTGDSTKVQGVKKNIMTAVSTLL